MLSSGNTDTTLLFEGESDHLVPSTSQILVESDMFLMAGRMVGNSFIHRGPCLSGISPAVMHVLLGQPPETATIQLQDCPDLDHHGTIQLVCRGFLLNHFYVICMIYFFISKYLFPTA